MSKPPENQMSEPAEDKAKLIEHLGELLNSLSPEIQTRADKSGLEIHLKFDAEKVDRTIMRRLATMVADNVA